MRGINPLYRAPQNPASRWFRLGTAPAGLLFSGAFRTIGGLARLLCTPAIVSSQDGGRNKSPAPRNHIPLPRKPAETDAGYHVVNKTTGPPRPVTGDRHDQGTFRNRNRCVHRSCSYHPSRLRPAGGSQRARAVGQGRPAGCPLRRLRAAILAQYRSLLPPRSRLEDAGARSPPGDRRAPLNLFPIGHARRTSKPTRAAGIVRRFLIPASTKVEISWQFASPRRKLGFASVQVGAIPRGLQLTAIPAAAASPHSAALPLTATIGALGVVYGDIGTSPLYALKEAAKAATHHGGQLTPEAILGVVSLILWALILIISLKYALLILRADNRGEGGIVALLALLSARNAKPGTWRAQLLIVGLIGAALLYGDGAITPAISVLSAIEGLKVDAPSLAPAVVPLTVVILIGLFLVQKKGTGFIGKIFGPVMLGWFVVLALLGIHGIVKAPTVLAALSPLYAFDFLIHQNFHISFAILGAAFLAVTGGEAMYADMGHFGRVPIRLAWFAIALPALVLNYFGQAALLIADPSALENPFYQLAPDWAHYPLIGFATAATVIASQAIISGAFSLTQQSIQLGFLPRVDIQHTASHERGQIYVPVVNWLLAAATLGAVIGRSE